MTKKSINQEVVNYLINRGIKKRTAVEWDIGYLSEVEPLLDFDNVDVLYSTGILTQRGNFSPLHKYVTFPLFDTHDRLVGFSGRTLVPGQKKRKYWHSILEKRRFLFGLHKAKEGIRNKGYAIVTEGQFDVIIAHQNNLTNVVCTMGTALTPEHIALLARYTNTVYVIFDGDTSGQRALNSQLERHKQEDPKLIPVILPEGYDVDLYIREHGPEPFEQFLSSQSRESDSWDVDL